MSRIVVLGDLNLDVHAQAPERIAAGGEIRSSIRAVPGGSAGTFARVAASEGAHVTFIGAVGTDRIGDLLIRSLEDHGVETRIVRTDAPSGTILALEQGNERTMVCSRGANDGLTVDALDEAAFREADHLHISGYAFLSPAQQPVAQRAIALTHDRRMTISVDPPPASLIEAFGVEAFLEALVDVAWLFPNRTEGELLTSQTSAERIVDALSSSFEVGALTLGPEGALAWSGDSRDRHAAATPIAGNTTGAGDAFAGTFVAARLAGASLAASNARACAAAAAHITRSRRG